MILFLNELGVTAMVNDSSLTRESLLCRARARQSQAWDELVSLYSPLVRTWVRQRGLGPDHTDDCIQDVFSAVAGSLDHFTTTGKSGAFRGWLWTITLNKVRDLVRKDGRHISPTGGSSAAVRLQQAEDPIASQDSEIDETEPTDALALQDLTQRAMRQIRDEFAERTWQIFQRAVVDDVPTSVVAKEFDVQAATVRQVRSRILRRLRQQLGDLV